MIRGSTSVAATQGERRAQQDGAGRRDYLLLAPLDGDADAALTKALQTGGIAFERRACALALKTADRPVSSLSALLNDHIPRALQARVKGVFTNSDADTPESMLSAFLQAEALAVLLEQTEVEWARDVLSQDRLFCLFHPIVEATTGQVFAYEALIRASHPENGEIVGASQLIYACEKLNLQYHLDQKARQAAIRDAAALQIPDVRFFINFLPGAVYDPEICLRTTFAAAETAGLDMERLVFEVVETEQIPCLERLRHILDYYRLLGARISLDDISSGYSSLQYLSALLPDYVKIDRHLVASAAASAPARHTLESIVNLAKRLGVRVIAEGIETPEHLRICLDVGADFLQGYYFARPASPPEPIRADLLTTCPHAA